MRQFLQPQLVNDAFGDSTLFVDLHEERRALLFDMGDLSGLPPRKLLRISHVFVSHTHMDHFAGFDTLLRVVLGRKPLVTLIGGPGFVAQVEHKLRAYTWNVVHRYAVELVLDVREVVPQGEWPLPGPRALFSSRAGFAAEPAPAAAVDGDVLHDEPLLRVRGRFVDHGIPCLAFVVEEKARVKLSRERLAALGVKTGAWLHELKRAVLAGAGPDTPIAIGWRDRDGEHELTRPLHALVDIVLEVAPGRRIGYVTDLRYHEENLAVLAALLGDVDDLFIESPFLDTDREHAGRKNHLTARQAGLVARRVGARAVVPLHFSPRYEERAGELRAELQAAYAGG